MAELEPLLDISDDEDMLETSEKSDVKLTGGDALETSDDSKKPATGQSKEARMKRLGLTLKESAELKAQGATDDLSAARKSRQERFGTMASDNMSEVITSEASPAKNGLTEEEKAKRSSRQERFGLATDDAAQEQRKAREAKFGTLPPELQFKKAQNKKEKRERKANPQKSKAKRQRDPAPAEPVDEETAAKRAKRNERFSS